MIEFLLAPYNLPFTVALAVMLIIAALEVVGVMIGLSYCSFLDKLVQAGDFDFDIQGSDFDAQGFFAKVLSWFSIKRVPMLVVLIVFLFVFGFSGLLLQDGMQFLLGFPFPPLIASIITTMTVLPIVAKIISMISKIIPHDETSAISRESLIGKTAEIVLGTARKGHPAQAKAKDRFGNTHYLMVEPDDLDDVFHKGNLVLLVRDDGVNFFAIRSK